MSKIEQPTIMKKLSGKIGQFLKNNRGFSLVELGIVLVIGAVMTIPIYTLLFYVSDLKPTDERMEIIQEALAEHLRVTGTLPCPADITADATSGASAYQASCGGAISVSGGSTLIGAVPIANLKVAVDCARNDGGLVSLTTDTATALKDSIYSLGEIFTGTNLRTQFDGSTLESTKAENVRCPLNEYIADERDNKFIYAVSTAATNTTYDIFNPNATAGGVTIQDTSGNVLSNNQPYVLISLGDDGKGGYGRNGTIIGDACGTSDADSENCDYDDNIFVAAPHNPSSANYYDDNVDYNIASFMQEDSFWSWGDVAGTSRDMILNPRAMLVLGPRDDASAGLAVEDDDGVVVNRGGVLVSGDLDVHAQKFFDGSSQSVNGGNLISSGDVVATSQETNIRNYAVSGRYCYESSKSLTTECGAPAGTGGSGCPSGELMDSTGACCSTIEIDHETGLCESGGGCAWYDRDGSCCPDDSFCCPASVYESTGDCHMWWD